MKKNIKVKFDVLKELCSTSWVEQSSFHEKITIIIPKVLDKQKC
jgi:hypothetical protein